MSWEQVAVIMQENRRVVREEQREPPVACPFDGTPLEIRADGVRNCPMGNYTYTGGPRII